jgi:gamma-glutamyltranspeptidase/glutathione hydrolase
MTRGTRPGLAAIVLGLALAAGAPVTRAGGAESILGSATYRAEVVGRLGVVAAGRHFAAEAGMRVLARGGNAVDVGVAATFAAAVTEISHFGLGGEVPILIHLADSNRTVVVNGQGPAPAAAAPDRFWHGGIPTNGPNAGTVPAVVDALALALEEFGTLGFAEVLQPAIELADGFPWYEFLARVLRVHLDAVRAHPSGARVLLQGPGGSIPEVGRLFRQADLARTLRALAEAERRQLALSPGDRRAGIRAARDVFYGGQVGQRIARAVQEAGGLLAADDLARYRGRLERPTRGVLSTRHGTFEVLKTGFWGQGPVLLQTLLLLRGFDLGGMGHNSPAYVHTVTEALKLALADRDAHYGDPDFARVAAVGLLSEAYADERRRLIDPARASQIPRPGDPWRFEPRGAVDPPPPPTARPMPSPSAATSGARPRGASVRAAEAPGFRTGSPDTTTVNVADARGNLFSASPSSAWFFGGVFVAGDTGVPLGNRMQAFVLHDSRHPNLVAGGKRPRTTLSPTIVLRDGKPWVAMSSPGGDAQDQQALQVLLNLAVFGMAPQAAIEAPRFNSLHHEQSFGGREFRAGVLQVEDRISPGTLETLRRLGHRVEVVGPFMIDGGTALAGVDPRHGTLFGAADVRRQRVVAGW